MAKAANHNYIFEFDETDVWFNNNNDQNPVSNHFDPAKKMVVPGSFRSTKKRVDRKTPLTAEVRCSSSLPVNVPDWSKIYRGSSCGGQVNNVLHDYDDQVSDDEDHGGAGGGGGGQESRVPPHEYLARRRGASFSVHEGIGRTLKGRDLRQVRNAIWEKVGFED